MRPRSEPWTNTLIAMSMIGSVILLAQESLKDRRWLHQALAQKNERGANFQHYKPPPQARCDVYKQQFDRKKTRLDSQDPQVNQAMKYRILGEVYCNTGHTQSGQKVLLRALELIGQKPTSVRR